MAIQPQILIQPSLRLTTDHSIVSLRAKASKSGLTPELLLLLHCLVSDAGRGGETGGGVPFVGRGLQQRPLQELLASPSASCTRGRPSCTRGRPSCTRGSLLRVQHSGKSLRLILPRKRRFPRVSKIIDSRKALPSAVLALGKDLTPLADGRRRFLFFYFLPRVQHSGKIYTRQNKNAKKTQK